MTTKYTGKPVYKAYVFDLDGTVYLGDAPLPTAVATITRLRQEGKRTLFLSNNPTRTCADYAAKLTRLGLPTAVDDVLNSSAVMVAFLRREMAHGRFYVIGEQPLCDEMARAGLTLSENPAEIQAVIASFDRTFTYRKLQIAFDALRAGARFFATNSDAYCPTPTGGEPDAAAIIAALTACTGVPVEVVVGKPSLIMAQAVLDRLCLPPEHCLMIGDRLETDILMGQRAGMATAVTLTGATTRQELAHASIQPTYVLQTLSDLLPPL